MNYRVRFIDDSQMPEGHVWAVCMRDGQTTLYLRRSTRDLGDDAVCDMLESAWEGYRNLVGISRA